MFRKRINKGFSLVELLVVITIIAILSVAAYSAVGGNTIKARDAKRKQDIGAIQQALELYYVEEGKYPTATLNAVTMGGAGGLLKKQLSNLPVDPQRKQDESIINYKYAVEMPGRQTYEIGATLEVDGLEAYVVGNSETPMLGGQKVDLSGACAPVDKSKICVPYLFE